jgi:uncharacterized C2H2 Zn-finger protein
MSIRREDVEETDGGFKCVHCEFSCRYKWQIEKHVNQVHNQSTPHVCDKCGKGFHDYQSCYMHTRKVHEGKYLYKGPPTKSKNVCDCCGRIFPSRKLMEVHVNSVVSNTAWMHRLYMRQ